MQQFGDQIHTYGRHYDVLRGICVAILMFCCALIAVLEAESQTPQFFRKDAAGNYVPYVSGSKPVPDTVYILLPTGEYYPIGPPPELPPEIELKPQEPLEPVGVTIPLPAGDFRRAADQSYVFAVEEDRALIESVIAVAEDFEANIKARLGAIDTRLLGNYAAYQTLWQSAVEAEGAEETMRDLQHFWTGEGVKTLEEVAKQFSPTRVYYPPVTPGSGYPKGPCSGEWRIVYPEATNGIEGCYSHKPTMYEYQNFKILDPLKIFLRETKEGGSTFTHVPAYYDKGPFMGPGGVSLTGGYGALPAFVEQLRFLYEFQLFEVEALLGRLGVPFIDEYGSDKGSKVYPASDLIKGIPFRTNASIYIQYAYPATGSRYDGWTLNAQMRKALIELKRAVEKGHAAWQSYETVLTTDYPQLVARAHARQIASWQRYVKAQEPIYDAIMELYVSADEDDIKRRFGNTVPDQVGPRMAAAFNAEHKPLLDALDEPWDCGWSLNKTIENLTLDVRDPVFRNPFPVVDEDATEASGAGIEFYPLAVPDPATSLSDMPVFGGLSLTGCVVEKAPVREDAGGAVVAEESGQKLYSAKDTALP